MELSQEQYAKLLQIVRARVRYHRVVVANFRHISDDDLTQVGLLAAWKAHDYQKAAEELLQSKWATQVGQRAQDIAHMIASGEDVL